MVLDDVADGARLIVESASALDPEVFRHGDLHALDWLRFQNDSSTEFVKRWKTKLCTGRFPR